MNFNADPSSFAAEESGNFSLINNADSVLPSIEVYDAGEGMYEVNFDDFLEMPDVEPTETLQKPFLAQCASLGVNGSYNASSIWTYSEMDLENQRSNSSASDSSDGWNFSLHSEIHNQPAAAAGITEMTSSGTSTQPQSDSWNFCDLLHQSMVQPSENAAHLQTSSFGPLPGGLAGSSTNSLVPSHLYSPEFLAGYLACLKDWTSPSAVSHSTVTAEAEPRSELSNHVNANLEQSISNTEESFGSLEQLLYLTAHRSIWSTSNESFAGNPHAMSSALPTCTFSNDPQGESTKYTASQLDQNTLGPNTQLLVTSSTKQHIASVKFIYTSPNGHRRKPGKGVTERRKKSTGPRLAPSRGVMRKKGSACGLCAEQRVKCNAADPRGPCSSCLKRALENQAVGSRICFGYNLKALESLKSIPDFYDIEARQYFLAEITFGHFEKSSRKKVKFCFEPFRQGSANHFLEDHYLELEVEEVDTSPEHDVVKLFDVKPEKYDNHIICSIPPDLKGFRIAESALPTKEALTDFTCAYFPFWISVPSDDVYYCLDSLLFHYINHQPRLPLFELADLTLRLVCIARYLGDGRPVEMLQNDRCNAVHEYCGQDHESKFIDILEPARTQIFIQAAKASHAVETFILERIDKLVFHRKSNRAWQASCSDPLVLGLCIRRMALLYRTSMARYKALGNKYGILEFKDRFEKMQKMYDTMTRHYRHVFRGTLSPFDADWKMEEHAEALGNDKYLISRFQQLKVAEENHCKDLDREDDGVYLGMFVNRQNRKGKSLAKTIGLS